MEKIPTAEETRLKYIPNGCVNIKGKNLGDGKLQKKYEDNLLDQMLIEFAKLHVEAYRQELLEKGTILGEKLSNSWEMDKPTVLNSYPLENIK